MLRHRLIASCTLKTGESKSDLGPEAERAKLVLEALEFFAVNAAGLPPDHKRPLCLRRSARVRGDFLYRREWLLLSPFLRGRVAGAHASNSDHRTLAMPRSVDIWYLPEANFSCFGSCTLCVVVREAGNLIRTR